MILMEDLKEKLGKDFTFRYLTVPSFSSFTIVGKPSTLAVILSKSENPYPQILPMMPSPSNAHS